MLNENIFKNFMAFCTKLCKMTFSIKHNFLSSRFSLRLDTFLSSICSDLLVFSGMSFFRIDLHNDLNLFMNEVVNNVKCLSGCDCKKSFNFVVNLVCLEPVLFLL